MANGLSTPMEELMLLRQSNHRLQQRLTHYKTLIQESFTLLNQKQTNQEQAREKALRATSVDTHFYYQINQQMQQIDCDIQNLARLLNNEKTDLFYKDKDK